MPNDALIRKLVPTLREDDYLLAVTKPAGVDVGGRPDQPPGLTEILGAVRGADVRLQPINRLSRYESGVLLIGKAPTAVTALRNRLRSLDIAQEYVAVVLGRMREPRLTIGPGPADAARKGRRRGRPKERFPQNAAPAATTLSLVKNGERRTLVRCRTHVRSTHELRAQLRSVGLRLMGDALRSPSQRRIVPEETCLHLTRMTFDHPSDKSKITLTSPPPGAFEKIVAGRRDIERALHAALTRRLTCLAEPDTDSYRLLTGDVEGMKGMVVEKYGPLVILQASEPLQQPRLDLPLVARWYCGMLDVPAVCVKRPSPGRAAAQRRTPAQQHSLEPLHGPPPPEQIVITERGLKFAIRPHEGQSVGLFLDHRDNRTKVRSMAGGRDVLNLFAYTCGFSVAAAAGGASLTVSVDLSPKSLKWGQTNFELNGSDPARHMFIQSEAFEYLARAQRQGRKFDLILLDPPSFAHGRKRGRDFSAARDLSDLISASLPVLKARGVMMISTNFRRLSLSGLRQRVKQAAGDRPYSVIETPPLPTDFAVDPDHAKTIFVRFD